MRHDESHELTDKIQFYQLIAYEGGDTLKLTEEEWSRGITYGLQSHIDDPHVQFHLVDPNLAFCTLTYEGAERIIEHLNLRKYFPDVKIEATPVDDEAEDVSEDGYAYWITFTHKLGNDDLSTEEEDRQLRGMEIVEDFQEDTDGCTLLLAEDTETGEQRVYMYYELYYLFTFDKEDGKMVIATDIPNYLEVLKDYFEDESLNKNILKIMINYVTYLLTNDLLNKINGYEEADL